MPHQPSPFSLLHLVSPACSFASKPLFASTQPPPQDPNACGRPCRAPWTPLSLCSLGSLVVQKAVCRLFVPPGVCISSTCTGHTIKLWTFWLYVCVCVVFAHQLKVWALSVSPSPLSTPVHHTANGNVHQRTFSSPSPLSAAHRFLCCSRSSLFWEDLQC